MKHHDEAERLFRDVNVVGGELRLATDQQVSEAEAYLGSVFPLGYREYVTDLGEGEYADLIKVFMPSDVLSNLGDYRTIVDEAWTWDDGLEVLTKERAKSSIQVASSDYGDMLIFSPGDPSQLFVLPRESEEIFAVGSDLAEALEWMRTSPDLALGAEGRNFKSLLTIEAEREATLVEALKLASRAKDLGSSESGDLSVGIVTVSRPPDKKPGRRE